jgi:NADH-quinone oxidoreductase subunit C
MQVQEIFELLASDFGEDVVFDLHAEPQKDKDPWMQVAPPKLRAVCAFLRDDPRLTCNWLECITGVDYPTKNQIAVVYHFYSHSKKHRVVLKAFLPRDNPVLSSLAVEFPVANWQERECYDLLGIRFDGHPDLRRILLPDDWEGHPLRKDYVEKSDYHGIPTTRPNPLDLLKKAKPAAGA